MLEVVRAKPLSAPFAIIQLIDTGVDVRDTSWLPQEIMPLSLKPSHS